MNPPTFEAKCVGMHFRGPRAQALAGALSDASPLQLEREPENEYDPNAIKVLYTSLSGMSEHIGYVEREIASFVAPWMDEGHEYSAKFLHFITSRNTNYPFLKLIPTPTAQAETEAEVAAKA